MPDIRGPLVTALAVGLLPLLAACGGGGDGSGKSASSSGSSSGSGATTTTTAGGAVQLTVPDGVDDATKKQYIEENAVAVCMRKQGFTYTPHVQSSNAADPLAAVDGEDYARAKQFRQKYGFGYYAGAVYPNDPDVPYSKAAMAKRTAPQDHDEDGLTDAQKKAYDIALTGPPAKSKAEEKVGGCSEVGRAAAHGPALSAAAEKKAEKARDNANHANGLALNGDSQLVQLAQQFATCLTGQGISVSTTQPTGMVDMVRLDISRQLPENFMSMSREVALPLLNKDIGIALKDLDCGKKFRAAYFPKEKAKPYYGEDG
ncbi:hypothetical protein R6V09_36845 [Streptomyces sp. W16]|uniref:hypothetical protein n=1 Tax=Streptomyces sp. W16 TaxID=3076631 RepID=UPI00295A87FE|nr:hypothetical protein [Streptomyces sp. W16]MDV9175670.1 hypothetical protein [Streptomyces sp. W16]